MFTSTFKFTWLASLAIMFATSSAAQVTSDNNSIYKDSSIVLAWATDCQLKRGLMNVAEPELGIASVGTASSAVGPAGENGVLSLGDGGEAILTFDQAISDHIGYDFAVYENSFDGYFLELAFVEVSSDGKNYFRFPADYTGDTTKQIETNDHSDPNKIHNLAGKYPSQFGTAFDLSDLKNISGLDLRNITHVKVIDVVGSISGKYATHTSRGTKINDPWPTPFASGGFDLDAVAVLGPQVNAISAIKIGSGIEIYPTHLTSGQSITVDAHGLATKDSNTFKMINAIGTEVSNGPLNGRASVETSYLEKGIYHLCISHGTTYLIQKIIIQ